MTTITNTNPLIAAWTEGRNAIAYAYQEVKRQGVLQGTHSLLNGPVVNAVNKIWVRSNDFASQNLYIPRKINFIAGLISLTTSFIALDFAAVSLWKAIDKPDKNFIENVLNTVLKKAALATVLLTGTLVYGCIGAMGFSGWPAYLVCALGIASQYQNL